LLALASRLDLSALAAGTWVEVNPYAVDSTQLGVSLGANSQLQVRTPMELCVCLYSFNGIVVAERK
jgi:hypothetical protein